MGNFYVIRAPFFVVLCTTFLCAYSEAGEMNVVFIDKSTPPGGSSGAVQATGGQAEGTENAAARTTSMLLPLLAQLAAGPHPRQHTPFSAWSARDGFYPDVEFMRGGNNRNESPSGSVSDAHQQAPTAAASMVSQAVQLPPPEIFSVGSPVAAAAPPSHQLKDATSVGRPARVSTRGVVQTADDAGRSAFVRRQVEIPDNGDKHVEDEAEEEDDDDKKSPTAAVAEAALTLRSPSRAAANTRFVVGQHPVLTGMASNNKLAIMDAPVYARGDNSDDDANIVHDYRRHYVLGTLSGSARDLTVQHEVLPIPRQTAHVLQRK